MLDLCGRAQALHGLVNFITDSGAGLTLTNLNDKIVAELGGLVRKQSGGRGGQGKPPEPRHSRCWGFLLVCLWRTSAERSARGVSHMVYFCERRWNGRARRVR
jgi:hypothetical protein